MEAQSGEALYLKPAGTVWGTFWINGEHLGPKCMTFCHILQCVWNHATLTLF